MAAFRGVWLFFPFALIGSAVLNFLPDYISLLETRWLMGRISESNAWPGYLILDLILTAGISMAAVFAAWAIAGYPHFFSAKAVISGRDVFSPFFYSAFFTSVWLWVYVVAGGVSRLLLGIGSGVGLLLTITDVEEQPFRSIGFTAVVLVSVGFLVGLPFVLLA